LLRDIHGADQIAQLIRVVTDENLGRLIEQEESQGELEFGTQHGVQG
jgi:hypothetical protein